MMSGVVDTSKWKWEILDKHGNWFVNARSDKDLSITMETIESDKGLSHLVPFTSRINKRWKGNKFQDIWR